MLPVSKIRKRTAGEKEKKEPAGKTRKVYMKNWVAEQDMKVNVCSIFITKNMVYLFLNLFLNDNPYI